MTMNHRFGLTAGLAAIAIVAMIVLHKSDVSFPGGRSVRQTLPLSVFASKHQEQDADMLYRRQQGLEYQVLQQALSPESWQIPIAVQFDANIDTSQTTHRPRLVWDIFGFVYSFCLFDKQLLSDSFMWIPGPTTIVLPSSALAHRLSTTTVASGFAA